MDPRLRAFFMKNDRFFASYLIFLLLFFSSMATRFEAEVLGPAPESKAATTVFVFLLLAALFLVVSLRSVFRANLIIMTTVSFMVTLGLFMGVSRYEDRAVEKSWSTSQSGKYFSRLQGHCSPRVGRTMVRYLDRVFRSKLERESRELRIDSECRLKHFRFLIEQGAKLCTAHESASKCNLRWAGIFGQSGKWDRSTREYFFERMMDAWQREHDTETLVAYVVKDQELADVSYVEYEKDQTQALNRSIFERVGEVVREHSRKSKPEPYHFKFKEAYSEYLSRSRQ
jgi:hypothetical protein